VMFGVGLRRMDEFGRPRERGGAGRRPATLAPSGGTA
jgi:hypothetical protein